MSDQPSPTGAAPHGRRPNQASGQPPDVVDLQPPDPTQPKSGSIGRKRSSAADNLTERGGNGDGVGTAREREDKLVAGEGGEWTRAKIWSPAKTWEWGIERV